VVAACRRASAHFSLTTGMNPSIAAAIGRIPDHAWIPIRYPDAFVDPDIGEMVSDAEAAETEYTAFTGRKKAELGVPPLGESPPALSCAGCAA
jgi:hypothetical protein